MTKCKTLYSKCSKCGSEVDLEYPYRKTDFIPVFCFVVGISIGFIMCLVSNAC